MARILFGDVPRDERGDWITVLQGDLYPDVIELASIAYEPILERFAELLEEADSAEDMYRLVMREPGQTRNRLVAVFRRYFTDVSTEVLGKQSRVEHVIRQFGDGFRDLDEARRAHRLRPFPDETLMTILYLNAQRGKSGYEFTDLFFTWFEGQFGDQFRLSGPRGSGRDLNLFHELEDYPKQTKADLLIRDSDGDPLVVGFARYDAHRGGSQEDDRIKGNNDNLTDLMEYAEESGSIIRVLFLNDGPGLVAGSMWSDYTELETRWSPHVVVTTLKMLEDNVTADWIEGY